MGVMLINNYKIFVLELVLELTYVFNVFQLIRNSMLIGAKRYMYT